MIAREGGQITRLRAINNVKSLGQLGIRASFVVWEAPRGSHRSGFMGRQLEADVRHVYVTRRKGRFVAPIKYFLQALMTLAFLARHRYQLVFVQSPPVFAALSVYIYSLFAKTRYIIDSHTDALLAPFWKWSLPLHRFLSRRAITTIVTGDHLQRMVTSWGAHALVLSDCPATFPSRKSVTLSDASFNVVFVSTASHDEPIDQVLETARALPDVAFHVTGDYRTRYSRDTLRRAPANVHFTGYLPDEEFYGLLDAADAVMSLTTEDHTFQSGASEALWLGKPIITSDWPLLGAYFDQGTIHVDNTAEGIRRGVLAMRRDLPAHQAGILALQEERRREWREKAQELMYLIEQSVPRR